MKFAFWFILISIVLESYSLNTMSAIQQMLSTENIEVVKKYTLLLLKVLRLSKSIEVPEIPLSEEDTETVITALEENGKKSKKSSEKYIRDFKNRILLLTQADKTEWKRVADFVLLYRLVLERAQMEELDEFFRYFLDLQSKK
jgi:hypothetical protein